MTQYARPDSDVSDGSFLNASGNNTNLYQSIDESSASDSDYVISTDSGYSADNMTVGLSNVTDPENAANHVVRYRAKGDAGMGMGGSVPSLTVALLEGTTQRASSTNGSVATSFTDYNFSLSTSEANAISDYTDLRLKFTRAAAGSGPSITISQAYFECDDASGGGSTALPMAMNTYRQMRNN